MYPGGTPEEVGLWPEEAGGSWFVVGGSRRKLVCGRRKPEEVGLWSEEAGGSWFVAGGSRRKLVCGRRKSGGSWFEVGFG